MNPGYFFIIMCWILIILILTEWLDFLWPDAVDQEKARRKAVIFLIMLVILQGFSIPIHSRINLNLGSIVLITVVGLYNFIKDQSGLRLQMLSVILFLGIFYGVAYEMLIMDPILMVLSPLYILPAFLVIFLLLTTNQIELQWLMLAAGFILGEIVHKIFLYKHVEQIFIGDALFRDHLMMGFLMLTVATYVLSYMKKLILYSIRVLASYRKQEGS